MDKPANYRIKVQGEIPDSWIDRLGWVQMVARTPKSTTLEGWLPDQAALSGLLNTLYELRLPLQEVYCLCQQGKKAEEMDPPTSVNRTFCGPEA